MEPSERLWIKEDQSQTDFKDHYADLTPFLQGGIVRDGGRLRRSSLVYDQVHLILSLSSHYISAFINESSYLRVFHTGWENTLTKSHRRYWIVRRRGLANKLVRDYTCRKLQQRPHINLTANRPRMKLFSPPFSVTGVQLFGPLTSNMKDKNLLRPEVPCSPVQWGEQFTWKLSRIFLQEVFLQDLRRLVFHHGWPDIFISDNGKCFVRAKRELRKLLIEGRKGN